MKNKYLVLFAVYIITKKKDANYLSESLSVLTPLLVVKILKALLSDTHIEVFILQFGLLMIFKQLATPIDNVVYRNFSNFM